MCVSCVLESFVRHLAPPGVCSSTPHLCAPACLGSFSWSCCRACFSSCSWSCSWSCSFLHSFLCILKLLTLLALPSPYASHVLPCVSVSTAHLSGRLSSLSAVITRFSPPSSDFPFSHHSRPPPPPQPPPTSAPPVAVSVCINDCACVFGMTLELILQHFKLSAINCKNVLFFHLHSLFTLHIHTFHCIRSYLYVCVCVCMGLLCIWLPFYFLFPRQQVRTRAFKHMHVASAPSIHSHKHTLAYMYAYVLPIYPHTHGPAHLYATFLLLAHRLDVLPLLPLIS